MQKPTHNAHAQSAPSLPLTFSLRDGRACLLRPMVEDDAEAICSFLPRTHAEGDFVNYMAGEFEKTVDEEREFIRAHNAKPCSTSMVAEVEGHIVGIAGGASLEFKRFAHHAECGLVVRKAFWNQGIGRKMMERLIEWSRSAGHRKLYLRVFAYNERAIRLYDSLGFVEEARLKGDVLRDDRTYADTIIMARFFT
jgi:RimJ/RimL family protein N-acetyltransferase